MINYSHIGGVMIRIFSDPAFREIEQAVLSIPAIDGVEYNTIINDPLPEILSYCDIVILKWHPGTAIDDLKKMLRPEAKLVLCVKREEEGKILPEDFTRLDDLWIHPFLVERATLRLTNLANEILRAREVSLYKGWLETLMDLVPDMIWFKNLDGVHLKVNKSFIRATGKTRKMIEGSSHSEIWGDGDEDCKTSEMEVLNSGEQRSFDEIIVIDNTPHHLKTHKVPFRDANGSIIGTLGLAQDLTSMLDLNLEIGIFVEAMPFPILITGENGKISHVNDKFLEMFNECRGDLIGAAYNAWRDWAFEDVDGFIGNTFRYAHGDRDLLLQFTEMPLTDSFDQPIGMVQAFMDVTAEKEMEAQIWKAANLDALTGLASRHGFSKWIEDNEELKHLLYLDLDNFKFVNDTYGHKAGDEALIRLADCIRNVFPEDFAARLGGDEFVICICRNLDVSELEELANDLQKNVGACFADSEEFKNLSLSIGARPYCDSSASIEKLLREADSAMYKAKEGGKARTEIWTAVESQ